MMSVLLLVLLIFKYTSVETARILAIFPTPSISHQVVFRPLVQELVKRGHELVVVTPDPAFPKGRAPANLTEIDVHDLSYYKWKRFVEIADGSAGHWFSQMEVAIDLVAKIFELQMKTKEVQETIFTKNAHFDLLLVEACVRTTLGLSHVFKAPVIQVSSFGSVVNNYEIVGASSHPFLYPSIFRDRLYNLTLWEKVTQLIKEIQINILLHSTEKNENEVLRRLFGSNVPPVNELFNNVEMLFLNVHSVWENNRPVPPNVVYMGGLHQKPKKELPKDLQSFLDSSKNGVIYISFGTNVQCSLLPLKKIKIITKVFSSLPYDIIFKWDKDELPGHSKNIKISKWLPQSDILRHPKLKLFITQGGLQSTDEAISAGVPLIGIPLLGDQWYNVEKYTHHKIGLGLNMETLTEETFSNAINTIMIDESYRQNIVRLRDQMYDQPQRPLDRAVWWTEYVLRHGNARILRAPSANMNWANYLELELVFTLSALALMTLLLLFLVTKMIWKFIYRRILRTIKAKIS